MLTSVLKFNNFIWDYYMALKWTVYFVALCMLFIGVRGDTEKTTTQEDSEDEVTTEPEKRYAYLKGDRIPEDEKYRSADEMYRYALKHVLQLFWTEKCHISEVKFQHEKLKTPLDEKINKFFDRVNELMGEYAEDILNTLRENITSSERIEPISPEKFDEIASIFKEVRSYFEEQIPLEGATEEMNIVRKEVRLADERLNEGYGIVKEMIKNTTLPSWS